MRLTVLGCAGSFPSAEAPCSAYLVEADGFRLMIDFGTGSLSMLQRYSGLYTVDAIVLTHLHADHIFDACSYVVARRYAPQGRMPLLPLYGPTGVAERLQAAYGDTHGTLLDDVYQFRTLQPGTITVGPFEVTAERVNHPVETYGLRVAHDGSALAYSADTAPCDALLRLAQGVDLFLCEASYLEDNANPPGLHLTGREAGEHATKAGVGRLLLTHLVPAWCNEMRTYDEAAGAFDGPIDIARPGARFVI